MYALIADALDEAVQHVHGRPRVIEGAMGRGGRRSEQSRERRQSHAGRLVPGECAARQPNGAQHRWLGPPEVITFGRRAQEPDVEAGVVGDKYRASAELEERGKHRLDGRGVVDHRRGDTGQRDDLRRDASTGVDQGRELAEDLATARTHAKRLEELNRQRRDDTANAVEVARDSLTDADRAGALIVVASPAISSGIVGLCAARLVEEFSRPAIAIEIRDGEGRGSCRSIPEFDVTALLRRHGDLFLRYGGHRAAAGFSIEESRLPEMKARLIEDANAHLDIATLAPTFDIDCELPLEDVDRKTLQWLTLLGPHGVGNDSPTFLARGVRVVQARGVGQDGSHLSMTLKAGMATWKAISFGNADALVPSGELADVIYTFKQDDFRGDGALQLEVLDLRPARDD